MKKDQNKIQYYKIISLVLIILILRILFYNIESLDYRIFLEKWYNSIVENGRVSSLGMQIGNYTPPYMLFLTIGTYITLNPLLWIKFVSFIFDIIMAVYASLIVKHFKVNKHIKTLLYILILPGVIINSAVLGQCDSIYTAFVMMFIYYILKDKSKIALLLYGVALSFKMQAIFIAPIILYLIITKKIKILDIIYVLVGIFTLMFPAMLFGKSMLDILKIYLNQTTEYNYIVKSAPNVYSFLLLNYNKITIPLKYLLSIVGILISILIVLCGIKEERFKYYEETFIIKTMLLSLIIPYVLPGMLDRYFYMANILILILFFIENETTKIDKAIIILISIAYFIPVFSINFLSYNQQILTLAENILISRISAIINTIAIFIIIDKYLLTRNIDIHKNEIK